MRPLAHGYIKFWLIFSLVAGGSQNFLFSSQNLWNPHDSIDRIGTAKNHRTNRVGVKPFITIGLGTFGGNHAVFPAPVYTASTGLRFNAIETSLTSLFIIDAQTKEPAFPFAGTLSLIPVVFEVSATSAISKHSRVKMGGGVGYVFTSRTLGIYVNPYSGIYKITEDVDNNLCYSASGGWTCRMSKSVALSFEVRYVWFQSLVHDYRKNMATFKQTTTESQGQINLDFFTGTVSLRF